MEPHEQKVNKGVVVLLLILVALSFLLLHKGYNDWIKYFQKTPESVEEIDTSVVTADSLKMRRDAPGEETVNNVSAILQAEEDGFGEIYQMILDGRPIVSSQRIPISGTTIYITVAATRTGNSLLSYNLFIRRTGEHYRVQAVEFSINTSLKKIIALKRMADFGNTWDAFSETDEHDLSRYKVVQKIMTDDSVVSPLICSGMKIFYEEEEAGGIN